MLKGLFKKVDQLLLRGSKVDEGLLLDLEEVLVEADVSLDTANRLVRGLRKAVSEGKIRGVEEVKQLLKEKVVAILSQNQVGLNLFSQKPAVYLVVGVNGTGKTTVIAKLSHRFIGEGKRVLLVASDTFRAAAIEQLAVWANRVGAEIISHKYGADPGAVVYDGVESAKARGIDFVIIDTAGRFHTKYNLMEELKKVVRVVERVLGRLPDETLLVLDATTGQNAIAQAKEFNESIGITGIVLTKLDGTAKGGIILSIKEQFAIPIKLVCDGQQLADLHDFEVWGFVGRLLSL